MSLTTQTSLAGTPAEFSLAGYPGSVERMHHRTAELAYQRAERRGFVPGRELDDWLEAEKEVLATLQD